VGFGAWRQHNFRCIICNRHFIHQHQDLSAGPVACVVLHPIIKMVRTPIHLFSLMSACVFVFLSLKLFFQHLPPPSYHARVVAAAVGAAGVVVLMISNVGLVQVTLTEFYTHNSMHCFVTCVTRTSLCCTGKRVIINCGIWLSFLDQHTVLDTL
jgi:hypothetical protein